MTPLDLIMLSTRAAQAHALFTREFHRMFPVNRPVRARDGEIGVRPTLSSYGENYVNVQVQTIHGPMTFGAHELTPASWGQVPRRLRPFVEDLAVDDEINRRREHRHFEPDHFGV